MVVKVGVCFCVVFMCIVWVFWGNVSFLVKFVFFCMSVVCSCWFGVWLCCWIYWVRKFDWFLGDGCNKGLVLL